MPNQTVYHNAPTGLTVYAYPQANSLTGWTTHRVQLVEGTGDNIGRYSGAVDDAQGLSWVVFEQAAQPSSWDDQAGVINLPNSQYTIMATGTAATASAGATTLTVTGLALDASKYAKHFLAFADGDNQGAAIEILASSTGTTINLKDGIPAAIAATGARVQIGGRAR